jgi:ABC-type proline/glycine betaine transport system substrate-binding protein
MPPPLNTPHPFTPPGSYKHDLEEAQRAEQRQRDTTAAGWSPRWFVGGLKGGVLKGEEPAEHVPLWQWAGAFPQLAQEQQQQQQQWPGSVSGQGFNPWQFPQMHKKLGL